jgi:hypothetical protein
LSAATAKTILAIITGATRRARIFRIELGFGSTTNTDAAVLYEIVRFTGADGTGTSVTPVALDPANPAAISTAKENYSAEPSTPVVLSTGKITPQPGGTLIIPFEPGVEPTAAVSTELGLRLTSPAAQSTVRATIYFEE